MTGDYTVRGVPASLAQDGWWLSCDSADELPADKPLPQRNWADLSRKGSGALLALVVLVALADWLFWGYVPGLSVALFSWALFGAAALLNTPDKRQIKPALLLLLLTSLPVIEQYQALSLGFQLFGLIVAVAWVHLPVKDHFAALPAAALHLLRALPLTGLSKFLQTLFPKPSVPKSETPQKADKRPSSLSKHFRNWSFPLGGALVLITLLLQANPLLEQSLVDILSFDLDLMVLLQRVLFWGGTALMIWPFLVPTRIQKSPQAKTTTPQNQKRLSFGLNAGSVLRALVMFNLILGVQSLMDLSILIGGAELPEGMTLARYAHRGAYPLLATAMLAGGFALAARPYLSSHASLKPLMMLWLGQNALLGLTSVLRLDLYVASFGLTYLRLYAMIWIGLVVAGLLLTAWQILKARSNRWLLLRCTGLGLGVLYLCAFVNFASVIAAQNLSMNSAQSPDWYYLCTLGPNAASGIQAAQRADADFAIPPDYAFCWQRAEDQRNWREWGFRSWRVSSYAGLDFDGTDAGKAKSDEDPIGR
ncbi:DUF4173 domain-containing protein [Pseudophaeobacter sp.]|uniref:DUF4153 domain-containing protein n=1 Tax=Pseudophaeobacter sp. TaxID=1971739 RepID=UPI003298CD42